MCSYLLEHRTSPHHHHHPPSLGYFPPAFFFRMCCHKPPFIILHSSPFPHNASSSFGFSRDFIFSLLSISSPSPFYKVPPSISSSHPHSWVKMRVCRVVEPPAAQPQINLISHMVWYGMVWSCGSATTAPTSNKPHITTWASGPRYEVEDEEDRWYNQLKKNQHFVLWSWCFNSRTLLRPFLPPVDVFQTARFR